MLMNRTQEGMLTTAKSFAIATKTFRTVGEECSVMIPFKSMRSKEDGRNCDSMRQANNYNHLLRHTHLELNGASFQTGLRHNSMRGEAQWRYDGSSEKHVMTALQGCPAFGLHTRLPQLSCSLTQRRQHALRANWQRGAFEACIRVGRVAL